jgi:hypothetical protein
VAILVGYDIFADVRNLKAANTRLNDLLTQSDHYANLFFIVEPIVKEYGRRVCRRVDKVDEEPVTYRKFSGDEVRDAAVPVCALDYTAVEVYIREHWFDDLNHDPVISTPTGKNIYNSAAVEDIITWD